MGWGVSLRASPERLTVHGGVEITDDSGVVEVFTLTGDPADAGEAAELIRRYAAEVCAQRAWMDEGDGHETTCRSNARILRSKAHLASDQASSG